MKPNKILALAALVAGGLFASGLAATAQDSTNTLTADSSTAKPHKNNLKAGIKALNLTEDQKPKVKAVISDQMQKMRALRKDTSLTAEDKRAKLKELRKDTNAKLKEILTPDQFAQWKKINSAHVRPTPARATENVVPDATN